MKSDPNNESDSDESISDKSDESDELSGAIGHLTDAVSRLPLRFFPLLFFSSLLSGLDDLLGLSSLSLYIALRTMLPHGKMERARLVCFIGLEASR